MPGRSPDIMIEDEKSVLLLKNAKSSTFLCLKQSRKPFDPPSGTGMLHNMTANKAVK